MSLTGISGVGAVLALLLQGCWKLRLWVEARGSRSREDTAGLQSKASDAAWLLSWIKTFLPGDPHQHKEATHVAEERERRNHSGQPLWIYSNQGISFLPLIFSC